MLFLPLGRSFPRLGDDFFEINFQNRRDAEQGAQRGVLDFLLHIADRLPRQAGLLCQHVRKLAAAIFSVLIGLQIISPVAETKSGL